MFSINIAIYFFLAGAGCGLFFVTVVFEFFSARTHLLPANRSLRMIYHRGKFLSVPVVAASTLFLLFDLGVPENFLLVFRGLLRAQGVILISFGALSIVVFLVSAFVHVVTDTSALRWQRRLSAVSRWVAVAAACCTIVYTGCYLWLMKAVSYWDTFAVVLLFVTSALSTGMASLVLCSLFSREGEGLGIERRAMRADAVLIVVEAALLAWFVASNLLAGGESAAFVMNLLGGERALLFWTGIVACGLLVPLAIELFPRHLARGAVPALVCCVLVLTGGLLLRCGIIGI